MTAKQSPKRTALRMQPNLKALWAAQRAELADQPDAIGVRGHFVKHLFRAAECLGRDDPDDSMLFSAADAVLSQYLPLIDRTFADRGVKADWSKRAKLAHDLAATLKADEVVQQHVAMFVEANVEQMVGDGSYIPRPAKPINALHSINYALDHIEHLKGTVEYKAYASNTRSLYCQKRVLCAVFAA